MKIPPGKYEREKFYQELILAAFSSRSARIATYEILKNYFLWGSPTETQPVEYNKLAAHIDLLASFLFSGETTSFVVEDDEDGQGEANFELEKATKIAPTITRYWHKSNMDIVFNEALIWALVYQCMFIKMVPSQSGLVNPYIVEPHSMGVLLEHEPMMDRQPCIVHEFFITKSDLARRVSSLPKADQDMYLALCGPVRPSATGTATPITGADRLIITASKPDVKGNVVNPTAAYYDFNPEINEDVCIAQELWVWDDDEKDYIVATMLESQFLLLDCKNTFVPKEQPFIKVCPNSIYNYFWGMSEQMRLIPIQDWVNERIPEIKLHLQKQTDPPKTASNITKLADDKLATYNMPGAWAFEEQTGLGMKVEQHFPAPINVFEILDRAEMMFAEVSGIRELMQGKGESGVRAKSHADLLVRVGSSRVKKKAAILEDAVEKIGHLLFLMMKKYDATHYKAESGMEFTAGQVSAGASVRVDSHSSSPIFIEQQIDKAQILFKAGAIDREDLIDALKPQNPANLKRKLKIREKMESAQKQQEAAAEAEKNKPKETTNA